jgi:hypothetical protein
MNKHLKTFIVGACILLSVLSNYKIKLDTYGTIEDTLDILHFEKKGSLMNTLEQFHIYKLSREGIHLKYTYTDTYNPIFNLITKHYK